GCNRAQAHELALDASPIAAPLRELVEHEAWSGTSSELLEALNNLVDDITKRTKGWPTLGRVLSGALRRLLPNLRAVGVEVEFQDLRELGSRRRQIIVRKVGVIERSQRSERSGVGLGNANDPIRNANGLDGNAGTPCRNVGNDGNAVAPVLSGHDAQEGE